MDIFFVQANLSARKVRFFGKNNPIFAVIIFTYGTNETNCDDDSHRAVPDGCT
jgi:hypothetical protein